MEEPMDQTAESTFSFGIEPIIKRPYQLSGKYKNKPKNRHHRRSGLKYRKPEDNTNPLVLVGFIGMPSEPVTVLEREVSL